MMKKTVWSHTLAAVLLCAACGSDPIPEPGEPPDPPEVVLGERLFLETRFAQLFAATNGARVNDPLAVGDPVLDFTPTTAAPLPGPFQGQSMNCRACHLVDELGDPVGGGVRTYADFARRSPLPVRVDGRITTPRNSPPLVNATLPRTAPFLLHFDGEFPTLPDLIEATITGRNFGWLPDEESMAVTHLAGVIRHDDGRGALAADFGNLPYPVVFMGTDPAIPENYRIPEAYRIDVTTATDGEIVAAVAELIGAYVDSLIFAQNPAGDFTASPYDHFLRKNRLPRQPDPGESDLAYSRRLRGLVAGLREPKFVTLGGGSFALHAQEFRFGRRELQGLRLFLAEAGTDPAPGGGVGHCVACHPAPNFTDFSFHNTGAAQQEYDAIHGPGAFAEIAIPDLATRNAAPEIYLPPSADYPDALGVFISVPVATEPGRTDLGVWNVLGNPAVPGPQAGLIQVLCPRAGVPPTNCKPDVLLPLSIALFKTPGLRSLGQSAPYLHTGQMDTLQDVLAFYVQLSALARADAVRNAAPELSGITLTADDVDALAEFLRSLNEDYS